MFEQDLKNKIMQEATMMMVTIKISRSIFRHTYIQCQWADIDRRKRVEK